jgi:hypothetical protein
MPTMFCSRETSNERPQMPVAFAFSGAMIVAKNWSVTAVHSAPPKFSWKSG